ncbi:hypothetical protein JHK87_003131 [Glycine soja]|nr:hypothetical protein JHK87_003131 [Glycine soja]
MWKEVLGHGVAIVLAASLASQYTSLVMIGNLLEMVNVSQNFNQTQFPFKCFLLHGNLAGQINDAKLYLWPCFRARKGD